MTAGETIILRRWDDSDLEALVRYGDNRNIWINLRDRFPHPYTRAKAEAWIAFCKTQQPPLTKFAIDLNGEAIGGIGLETFDDVHRLTAEVGYWLGEPFWGRGIATAALNQLTAYAFATFPFQRLQATVFGWNPASARVLEKGGYVLEGRMRQSIIKDGRVGDLLLYARVRN